MSEFSIEMKGISKAFPGVQALRGVDLKIKPGEIHALLGENGAGKSTMMNVLTGQIMKCEGEIYAYGKALNISSPNDAFKNNIVMVPQELNLIPNATVAENIFLGNERHKNKLINWKNTESEAIKILEGLGVEIDVNRKAKDLSPALQQLISIARALAYSPKILILDEPTAVLTNKEKEMLFTSIQKMKKGGTSIIFITHHLDEVLSEADRMTIMRDGELVEVARVEDMSKDDIINSMAGKTVEQTVRVNRTCSDEVFFEAKNLSRKGEFEDVSFKINCGEILCVAGLVGAGRTEIFKTVFGITLKDPGGKTFVQSSEVEISSPVDAIELGMGYISEERRHDGITPGMSVMENMMLPSYGEIKKNGLIDFKETFKIASGYVDKLGIRTPSCDALIRNLSGGNQQKVIVARWIAKGIKMLIMDEPTRGIDVNAKQEIHQLVRELADSGVAVVVISSEMDEVLALADRIMVIHQGKVSGYITNVDEATEESVLRVAFQ